MEKFLKDWRQDALNKHQYESAIFIGDKLLALTSTFSPLPLPVYILHLRPLIIHKKATKMPFGWLKSISQLETTLELKAFSRDSKT
jgi:hypothetical protein